MMAGAADMGRNGRLQGKVALITGTGGSIGRACAESFAKEGAKVIGCDIDIESAEETLQTVVDSGGEMISVQPCDLIDPEQVSRLIAKAVDAYGRLDVLLNNAAKTWFEWIPDMTYELWRKTFESELDSVFLLCREAWPHLTKNEGASIINMGAASAKRCYEMLPALAHMPAKAGVLAMTKHLAMEGAPFNLRVNSISPGPVLTKQTVGLVEDKEWLDGILGELMIKRLGQPEDIAPAAVFLASDEASWITGMDLAIDGGSTAM